MGFLFSAFILFVFFIYLFCLPFCVLHLFCLLSSFIFYLPFCFLHLFCLFSSILFSCCPYLYLSMSISWFLVSGLWSLISGLWSLVSGLWSLVHGLWSHGVTPLGPLKRRRGGIAGGSATGPRPELSGQPWPGARPRAMGAAPMLCPA